MDRRHHDVVGAAAIGHLEKVNCNIQIVPPLIVCTGNYTYYTVYSPAKTERGSTYTEPEKINFRSIRMKWEWTPLAANERLLTGDVSKPDGLIELSKLSHACVTPACSISIQEYVSSRAAWSRRRLSLQLEPGNYE